MYTDFEEIHFNLPDGFGSGRPIMVSVNGRLSEPVWFSYDPPQISNVAPRVPQGGMLEVVIEGENFCGGKSCSGSECCGRLYVNGEIVEIPKEQYTHSKITAHLSTKDSLTGELWLGVQDHPISTKRYTFDRIAPAIGSQIQFGIQGPFETRGGQTLNIFDVSGVSKSDESDTTVFVGGKECKSLRVLSVEKRELQPFANLSCTTPPHVGEKLPVTVQVHDSLSAQDFHIDYARPTICFAYLIDTEGSPVILYDRKSSRCSSLDPRLGTRRRGLMTQEGVSTLGELIVVTGFNLGSSELGMMSSISIEDILAADIGLETHDHGNFSFRMPPGAGKSLKVQFFVGSFSNVAEFELSYAPPRLFSLFPNELPTLPEPSDTLILVGENFGPASVSGFVPNVLVSIDHKTCTVISSNQTTIICIPPSGQGNKLPLNVTIEGQSSLPIFISYRKAWIDSVVPATGPTSGLSENGIPYSITIYGSNFGSFGQVYFESSPSPVSNPEFNHSTITFRLPEGYGRDVSVNVVVGGWGEVSTLNEGSFSYDPPAVTDVVRLAADGSEAFCRPTRRCIVRGNNTHCYDDHPDCFPTTGNVPVKIKGINFGSSLSAVKIFIGENKCSIKGRKFSFISHTAVHCTLPSGWGSNLVVDVTVGGQSSASVDELYFSYDPPRISDVSPNVPDAEGAELRFRGSNFGPAGGDAWVMVGERRCMDPIVRSHSIIECTMEADVVGAKEINLTVARQQVVFPAWREKIVTMCQPEWYGLESETCLYCPDHLRGAVCPGRERTEDKTYADEGWWKINEPTPSSRCHDDRQGRETCPVLLPCEPPWACTGSNECAEGYSGERCSSCVAGTHFRINGECQACPNHAWLLGVVLSVAAIGAIIGGYIINSKNIQLAAFTVGVDYFQVIAMFARTRVQWPSVMEQTLQMLSVFNFNLELAAPECYLEPAPPYESKWIATMSVPLIAVGILFVLYAVHYGYKLLVLRAPSSRRHTHVNSLIATFIVIMYILYMFLTRMTLDVFNCAPTDPPDGKLYMSGMTDIVCGESSVHVHLLLPLAVISCIVYVAAFPLLSYMLLRRNKQVVKHDQILRAHQEGKSPLTNPHYVFRKRFQRLYYLFTPGKWYWISLILLRKFLIALTSLMFRTSPSYQLAFSLLVIFTSYVLHVRHQPYMSVTNHEDVIKVHQQKVEEGDKLHMKIESLMKEHRERNAKALKKADGWDTGISGTATHSGDVLLRSKALRGIIDFNVVENVLLASAILVNLAGIMFLSGRFQGELRDRNEGEFELLGIFTMLIIVFTCVYFILVFVFELLLVFHPSMARALASKLCRVPPKKPGSKGAVKAVSGSIGTSEEFPLGTQVNPLVSQEYKAKQEESQRILNLEEALKLNHQKLRRYSQAKKSPQKTGSSRGKKKAFGYSSVSMEDR
eukprot:gb/GECG01013454.1/.p1 GENE.gb/GECG01013454.1/~~gb/GECG01013454.1/.p1  ORF type:complete len:1419 (+),score=134.27 gb/GECG01013454.1/:1-4257(+)